MSTFQTTCNVHCDICGRAMREDETICNCPKPWLTDEEQEREAEEAFFNEDARLMDGWVASSRARGVFV